MATLQAFGPSYGTGQSLTAGAASLSVTITKNSTSLCVTNTGSNVAYVRVGSGTVTATTADMPVLGGDSVYLTKDLDHDKLAYISADGTTLHAITGEGGI